MLLASDSAAQVERSEPHCATAAADTIQIYAIRRQSIYKFRTDNLHATYAVAPSTSDEAISLGLHAVFRHNDEDDVVEENCREQNGGE